MGLDQVLHRKVPEPRFPVHRRKLLCKIELACGTNQIGLRAVRWEHRPNLVLLSLEPVDEQHLHRAATVPVSLLVVRLDAADACTEALRIDSSKPFRSLRRDAHLPLGGRRTTNKPHLSVGPVL